MSLLVWVAARAAAVPDLASDQLQLDTLRLDHAAMKDKSTQDSTPRIRPPNGRLARTERTSPPELVIAQAATQRPTDAKEPKAGSSPLDQAIEQLEPPSQPAAATPPPRASEMKLIDVSINTLIAAGWSTESDASLETLEGGGHDPKRRGFTLQQAELGFKGAVDPYLTGEAYIVFGEENAEVEEAYFTTQTLPHGLQLKAGLFLTEFGRINPTHPHSWYWQDQPFIATRLLGGDGLRSAGARLAWLLPSSWYSELYVSVQNANNETLVSFRGAAQNAGTTIGERPIDTSLDTQSLNDMLYLLRWDNSWDVTNDWTTKLGFSAVAGPNNTGTNGDTQIYGMDVVAHWRPASNFRGWPFLHFEGEVMRRDYAADAQTDPTSGVVLPATTLRDWGYYMQMVYGFHYRWSGGLRIENAGGSGESVGGRAADPYRDNRYRISPLLVWDPTEFARFRLQYNYDHADHLADRHAQSIWLGAEILYGAHPAHKF
jgi:hypothetical protein